MQATQDPNSASCSNPVHSSSNATFSVTAGTTYFVVVDGAYPGASGTFTLSVVPPT